VWRGPIIHRPTSSWIAITWQATTACVSETTWTQNRTTTYPCHSTHQVALSWVWDEPAWRPCYTEQPLQQCSLGKMSRVTPGTCSLPMSPSSVGPQTVVCKVPDLLCTAYFDYNNSVKLHHLIYVLPAICLSVWHLSISWWWLHINVFWQVTQYR
jgi:hypothetical protein